MEPWRVYRQVVVDSHHLDTDPHYSEKLDPDLDRIKVMRLRNPALNILVWCCTRKIATKHSSHEIKPSRRQIKGKEISKRDFSILHLIRFILPVPWVHLAHLALRNYLNNWNSYYHFVVYMKQKIRVLQQHDIHTFQHPISFCLSQP